MLRNPFAGSVTLVLIIILWNPLLLNAQFDEPIPGRPPEHTPQYGPWNRDLVWYESTDGENFNSLGTFVERAGVPSLARGADGKLYAVFQWFPLEEPEAFDQIAVMRSEDGGKTWFSPQTIQINGMPEGLFRAFDPTLIALPDGRFRLYFTSERVSGLRMRGNRAIFSAISSDALQYDFEPGERFGFEDQETYDTAVTHFKGAWHLYCPVQGEEGHAYHAISDDGLNFTEFSEVSIEEPWSWIGNVLAADEELLFYGSGPEGAWLAHSDDGEEWALDSNFRLPGGDPAVIQTDDHRLLLVVTGLLREDALPGPPPFF